MFFFRLLFENHAAMTIINVKVGLETLSSLFDVDFQFFGVIKVLLTSSSLRNRVFFKYYCCQVNLTWTICLKNFTDVPLILCIIYMIIRSRCNYCTNVSDVGRRSCNYSVMGHAFSKKIIAICTFLHKFLSFPRQ